MTPALLLIDLQNDFLERPGLYPESGRLLSSISALLTGFRQRKSPVIHIHTAVRSDGENRMPHWKESGRWACIEGTPGALAPHALAPAENETVITKRFFSGFESGSLHEHLRANGIDTLVVAGLYTHGCVRATVLDAYAKGYTVWVAADGVASAEHEHAQLSQQWLNGRAARFLASSEILRATGEKPQRPGGSDEARFPAACIGGIWADGENLPLYQHHNPSSSSELLAQVPIADARLADQTVQATSQAQSAWAETSYEERLSILANWADKMAARKDQLIEILIMEIGKPRGDATEEADRAVAYVRATVQLLQGIVRQPAATDGSFSVRDRPVGTIGLVTPWNNPIAIPVGKIAPALAFGNAVVWKPALPTPRATMAVIDSLREAGVPPSLLSVLFGDSETAQSIIAHPKISAISLTGSGSTGRQLAALCSRLGKPLQAELGGNNAAIVMADADLERAVKALAVSAFGFAGQRCTATRRIIVDAAIRDRFVERFISEIRSLNIGDPAHSITQVGPLISDAHRNRVMQAVQRAMTADRGRLLCGGSIPAGCSTGNWYLPTLIDGVAPDSCIVQEETFGPVAAIQPATGFDAAMQLCNGVTQGLVASLYSRDEELQQRFLENAQAGILRINPATFAVHATAPFCGWKASGIGPAEHGRWDREFYTRPQAIYDHGTAQAGIRRKTDS